MKKTKSLTVFGLITTLAILLSGCVRTTKAGKPYGFVYDYLAKPAQAVMEWIAGFTGSYGWAIIVLTVIVRMFLLPMMVRQMKSSTIQQEKMQLIRPQLNEIQKRQKAAKSPEEQAAISQAMMSVYKENNISMTGGIGCLPLLIQMPIFAALYAAIRYSPELSHEVFMGIKLGQASLLLAVLSFITYLLQSYLSLLGIPKDQKKQTGAMLLMSPIMILLFTINSPAGLGIYFFIGGLFACLQTLIINLYRPKIRKDVAAEMKDMKTVSVDDLIPKQPTTTETPDEFKNDQRPTNNRTNQRNAGKQNRGRKE